MVGLGKSGIAAARLLVNIGACVFVTEKLQKHKVKSQLAQLPKNVVCETGGHRLLRKHWDLVVVSPGTPLTVWAPLVKRGIPVWGELELGYRVLSLTDQWPQASVAVTGTNGKTTTTALLGEILRQDNYQCVVAGNIGKPLCSVVDLIFSHTALILEVSSYQLESVSAFQCAAGIVLNVTPDHLGRHKTMESYARTKFHLFQNMRHGSAAVLNAADPWCQKLAHHTRSQIYWFERKKTLKLPGAYFHNRRLISTIPGRTGAWGPPKNLLGQHNVENALASVACARFLGVNHSAIQKAFVSFQGVEHRLERVRKWNNVLFVNDSKSTNVDSTLVALQSFSGRVHVILGGQDKGAPYAPLISELKKKAVEVLVIGEAGQLIQKELSGVVPTVNCQTLENAVRHSLDKTQPGDIVLLSPACASFDQFQNFEHRGACFKRIVNGL